MSAYNFPLLGVHLPQLLPLEWLYLFWVSSPLLRLFSFLIPHRHSPTLCPVVAWCGQVSLRVGLPGIHPLSSGNSIPSFTWRPNPTPVDIGVVGLSVTASALSQEAILSLSSKWRDRKDLKTFIHSGEMTVHSFLLQDPQSCPASCPFPSRLTFPFLPELHHGPSIHSFSFITAEVGFSC